MRSHCANGRVYYVRPKQNRVLFQAVSQELDLYVAYHCCTINRLFSLISYTHFNLLGSHGFNKAILQ